MLFVVLCPGTPKGSTGSNSAFEAPQKTVQRLKVSSDRLREAGNRTCDPGLNDIGLKKLFVAFLGINQFRQVDLRFVCWFHDGDTQRLSKSGFMEKPGIEPAIPGLQGKKTFCCFPGYKPVPPGWFKICVGFITGAPKGSPKVVLWRSRESNCDPWFTRPFFWLSWV